MSNCIVLITDDTPFLKYFKPISLTGNAIIAGYRNS